LSAAKTALGKDRAEAVNRAKMVHGDNRLFMGVLV
jgi:hypothetical protein